VAGRGANAVRGNSPMGINSRKTHCDSGHEFTEENTYRYRGNRQCRKCRHKNDQKAVERRRQRRQAARQQAA
jgi:hypothetical protein